ncbi:MAG: 2-hydroxyacyl-CoA dehydratase, partial [Acutalibacteraceae bacterium]|nr:2-hydroxyacyl-CoA dehydratase [Acutalibacteraceae bacterium]
MNPENRVEFTKDMKDYTLLAPNMADVHFSILINVFAEYGYKVELLKNDGRAVVDEGLKYVHNDTCYPALLVIGQLIDALNSGKYDVNKTALMITQSGGGCRASNYIHLLRKALRKAGYGHVPVISLNLSGLEKNSGFKIRLSMAIKMLSAMIYGDLIMLLKNQVEPYEVNIGETNKLVLKWIDDINTMFKNRKGYS